MHKIVKAGLPCIVPLTNSIFPFPNSSCNTKQILLYTPLIVPRRFTMQSKVAVIPGDRLSSCRPSWSEFLTCSTNPTTVGRPPFCVPA